MGSVSTQVTLAKERDNATFDPNLMDLFINGEAWVNTRNKILDVVRKQPEIFDMSDIYFLNREGEVEKLLKQEKRVAELIQQKKLTDDDAMAITYIQDASGPYRLHRGMFMPTLERQATDEQKKAFLEKARNYEIIGCYAQTEMGHGSNVRGLETTATYIQETDEFEVDSPTLTSTKWWIGGLGVAATHACVMAQLIIKNKNYGVYPIVVPIRSTVDHKPLPGVSVGDHGPKMGFNGVDNGFVNFDKVRVPRFNLLQRYITVDNQGNVTIPSDVDPRVTYSTMVYVRSNIVNIMGKELSKAVTIAVRYTSVRRQFGDDPNKSENPVLDYPIVQYRLIPLVAKTYMMLGMSHEFYANYERCRMAIEKNNDFSLLKEMHAVSCGLKKWCSDTTVYGIDTCRHVCGGHGFSLFSGLNTAFANLYPNIIWEGDNFVLAQQTARYILKVAENSMNSSPIESDDPTSQIFKKFKYDLPKRKISNNKLWNSEITPQTVVSNEQLLLNILAYKVAHQAYTLATKINVDKQSWNDSLVAVQILSTVYSEYMLCHYFYKHLGKLSQFNKPESDKLASPLSTLMKIGALGFLLRNTGELYDLPEETRISNHKIIDGLETEYLNLIKSARKIAVPLVDALGIPDEKLNSSLGRYDGNVYEDYMTRALSEPLNREKMGDELREQIFKRYIEPVTKYAKL
ncbi:hypothetical protein BB558_001622 [Smittium angustum]|uniref:Acyl-coenzyme A oxidase n=1 Tax=Smittium angustum TaxID=133377 RepID=A0A2U1JB50_SMIAN|nr:hypothetical protein BB558_001622 [Smittium angustum]